MAQVDILISSSGSANISNSNIPGSGGSSASNDEAIVAKGTGNSRKAVARSVYIHQLINAGTGALKSAFNVAKSNYGNFTGDYIGQQKIDNAFGVANILTSFGTTVGAGAIAGGPIGAGAAVVVSGINIGMSAWENNINYNQSLFKANFSSKFNAQRLGTILNGGNR